MVTGSEKQMKWYEEILKEAYDYLDARYNHKIADEVEKQAVSLTKWPSLWHSVCLSTKTANSLCANLLQKNLKKSKRLYIKRVIGR